MLESVREPAVAGSFYPAEAAELGALVDRLLATAPARTGGRPEAVPGAAPGAVPEAVPEASLPKALIVPHAGYVYSGPIAAAAFARVAALGERIARVVMIGPAHRVPVEGLVWPGVARLRTPLGEVEVDVDAIRDLPGVAAHPAAHAREHSLEVMLPFLQRIAPRAKVVPLVGSDVPAAEVGRVLEALWGGPETLIVISSDLSHYLPYREARTRDEHTAARIVGLDDSLSGNDACGAAGVNGLLWLARRRRMRVELVDLRSSGDTAGPRDEVVGYGAFALHEAA
ncbi:MAG TPA: AmmeMemoRadiSam system protein B [Kofleriaceae bacterium]|nr:AmmeMemoRadiSam system protein B [Kofleriaceae bacterium]